MNLEMNRVYYTDVKHDPVRPDLSLEFRLEKGREIYALMEVGREYGAFVCIAYTNVIPYDISDIEKYSEEGGRIAVPYTVWSTQRGFGRELIKMIIKLSSESNTIKRVVTLSPKTDMARKFHTKNGAVEIRSNADSTNFEYLLAEG